MKKTNIILFLGLIIIFIMTYNLIPTLAKYISRVNGTIGETPVAKWTVKLNDEDISNKTTLDGSVKINLFDNPYVAKGLIAPGSEGYFDISIDTSDADVATMYSIVIDEKSISNLSGFEIVSYQMNDGISNVLKTVPRVECYKTTNGTINGTILLENNKGKKVDFRIYVRWKDNNKNNEHVQASIAVDNIALPINVVLEQYFGQSVPEDKYLEAFSNKYIGKYVDLGKDVIGTDVTTDDWRVLYVDESNQTTYLILADYLPVAQMPAGDGIGSIGKYSILTTSRNGSLLLNYFDDSTKWSNLISSDITGATVKGATSPEIMRASYLASHNGFSWKDSTARNETVYVPHSAPWENCSGYWLNTIYEGNDSYVSMVYYTGAISTNNSTYNNIGIRPVVSLPIDTPLEIVD